MSEKINIKEMEVEDLEDLVDRIDEERLERRNNYLKTLNKKELDDFETEVRESLENKKSKGNVNTDPIVDLG